MGATEAWWRKKKYQKNYRGTVRRVKWPRCCEDHEYGARKYEEREFECSSTFYNRDGPVAMKRTAGLPENQPFQLHCIYTIGIATTYYA